MNYGKWKVYHYGYLMGETCAVSEAQACNQVRYRTEGPHYDDGEWSAVPVIKPEPILESVPVQQEKQLEMVLVY